MAERDPAPNVARTAPVPGRPRVVVLADDLIWGTRLVTTLRGLGAEPVPVRSLTALAAVLPHVEGAIVDLTARTYDGLAGVTRASEAAVRTIAVGQHDDHALRRRALEAGAERVYAYRKLFEDGPSTLAAWLRLPTDTRSDP